MATDYGFFSAFIENPADIEVLNAVTKQLNIKNYEVIEGGIKEAIELYQGKKSPLYLIVDISKSDLPVTDMARLYEVCSPEVSIIVIGLKNEVSLYRDLSRLGIYEYLLSPLFPEILESLLRALLTGKGKEAISSTKAGKIITCMGSRGGAGTTFIASNLAAMLAGEKLRRVVLLDLDPYFGTLSLNFDLKASVRLKDAFEDPERIDQVFIERLLTPINERLFLLGSEEPLETKTQYNVEALEEILKYLSKQFHYVIIDVPHTFNDLISTMFKKANLFLLFTEPNVAGLRDTGRILHFVQKEGAARRCIISLNKMGQYGRNEIKRDAFEAALKNKVDHVIGYDADVPMDCLNQGKTLVNEENAIARSIRGIMLDILGIPKPQEKMGWFKKLF
jgi:pilus assembly protein CpaE